VPDVPPAGTASLQSRAPDQLTSNGFENGRDHDAVREQIRAMVLDEISRAMGKGI
jgi:hypothetical protein